VDHDRLFVRVVVEDDHLQQATGPVCSDDEIPAVAWDDSCRMVNGVQHVFIADAVLSGAVRDLHLDKVALSASPVKVALSTVVAITVPPRTRASRRWRSATMLPSEPYYERSVNDRAGDSGVRSRNRDDVFLLQALARRPVSQQAFRTLGVTS